MRLKHIEKKTDQDAYPLYVIDEILDNLEKAKFVSALDLSLGFHQIPLNEDLNKYTTFSTFFLAIPTKITPYYCASGSECVTFKFRCEAAKTAKSGYTTNETS